jgi:UDP-N-acetylmuramoyl-tripeptide--D-alanyl-D-alanine ligase
MVEEARAAGMAPDAAVAAADNEEAARWLRARLRPGDWVLVKGSRAMGMESVATAIAR